MRYISTKRFKRNGIGGRFNIPYGKFLEKREDGALYFCDGKVCLANSAAAHEYFARDDDGEGLRRGLLSHAIVDRLAPRQFDSREERNEYWEKVWNDKIAQKYRRPEHVNYWLWNDDFYNAPIEDLKYIAALAGVKKGLTNYV